MIPPPASTVNSETQRPGVCSGGECELVLLDRFLYPGAQSGFLEGPEERLLGAVVLEHGLLGLVVRGGSRGFDAQAGRELKEESLRCQCF